MVNVVEWLWFGLVLCGMAVLSGIAGYYEYRHAEAMCRRRAEAAEGMPRFFRWLAQPKFLSSPECVSRYRSTGVLQMVGGAVFLIVGSVTILVCIVRLCLGR